MKRIAALVVVAAGLAGFAAPAAHALGDDDPWLCAYGPRQVPVGVCAGDVVEHLRRSRPAPPAAPAPPG